MNVNTLSFTRGHDSGYISLNAMEVIIIIIIIIIIKMMMIIIIIIIIIIATENSHIGHCTHTAESTNVKVQ
jgi:hypothetical protein